MDTHRIDVFDGADDDAIVRLVADNFHLVLLPAEHAFLDQHGADRGGTQAVPDDLLVFLDIVGHAAAFTAKGEGRAHDGRQADMGQRVHCFLDRMDEAGARGVEADLVHRLAEQQPVFRLLDGFQLGADQLDIVFIERAVLGERNRRVQRGLSAHGRQQRVRALFLDDAGDHLGRDRLDIGRVGKSRIGHDRGRVRVYQDDPVAFFLQGLAGLSAGIVELAGLTDDDRAGPDDHDGLDICTFGHGAAQLSLSIRSTNRWKR